MSSRHPGYDEDPADWAGKPRNGDGRHTLSDADVEAAIKHLATLSRPKYERLRLAEAERLGMRASALDICVKTERGDAGDGGMQGKTIEFPTPEPWPKPVDGDDLLHDLAGYFARYAFLPSGAKVALALWAMHTYVFQTWEHTARLHIKAATKNSGKTTVLDLLHDVVARALPAAHATPSALFRTIELAAPTLLLDEVDTYLNDADETRGILNAGHKRGGMVLRTVGENHEARAFAVFSPCAMAGIGTLHGTLADRAITVTMKRALPHEMPARWTTTQARAEAQELSRRMARWTTDHRADLEAARPEPPDTLYGRAADNWIALCAIAAVAGGDWPELARTAAVLLTAGDDDHETLGIKLLWDIREVFTADDVYLGSQDLVERLVSLESRPWPEMGRGRKPLTQNTVARLLRQFKVAPGNVGPDTRRVRGYTHKEFTDVFDRLLPPIQR